MHLIRRFLCDDDNDERNRRCIYGDRYRRCICRRCNCECCNNSDNDNDNNERRENLLTITSNASNGITNDLLTISSNCRRYNDENNNCNWNNTSNGIMTVSGDDFNSNNNNCNFNCNNTNNVEARTNIDSNDGRTGTFNNYTGRR